MKVQALIPRNSLAWLLTAQIVVLLPHLPRLPLWVAALWLICAIWRVQIQRMRWGYPGIVVKVLALGLVTAGVYASQRTFLGLDSAVMLLLMLFMLKLLEMRSPRDALVVIYLGFFIVATAFLFDQSILLAAYQCFSMLVLVAALVGLQQTPARNDPAKAFRTGAVLLLQAVPLMLLLFFVFPRMGPLWAVNAPGQQATIGLAESMAPGDIADLARSGELAFRVSFDGQIPRHDDQYWRAMTLTQFDGRRWSHSTLGSSGEPGVWRPEGQPLEYRVVTRASNQPWLFSLRGSTSNDSGVSLTRDFMLQADRPVDKTMAYSVTSWPQSVLHPNELDPLQRRLNLNLPADSDPRTREWARQLRETHADDAELISALLQHFNREPYHYTLRPDTLGRHTNDEFLFDTQRGFCAHYAGAMVFVLRAAGIPARVIAGYQGGEVNPRGNYVLVHQFDAHAWVEAWLHGQGWVTFDPTFQVAPERIEQGLEEALRGEGSFLEDSLMSGARYRDIGWLNRARLGWDQVNYQWQLRVLGYESQRQMELFQRWLGTAQWRKVGLVGLAIALLIMLPLAIWTLRPPKRSSDPRRRAWERLNQRLQKLGLQAEPSEGPRDWQVRLTGHLPQQARQISEFFDEYVRLTYALSGDIPGKHQAATLNARLTTLLRNLPGRRPPGAITEVKSA